MNKQLRTDIIKWGTQIHDALLAARDTLPRTYTRYVAKDLGGGCAIASYFLKKRIKTKYKKEVKLVHGTYNSLPHCWLLIDNIIVDITKIQFHKKANKVSFCKPHPRYKILNTDRYALKEVKQWAYQSPLLYKIRWKGNSALLEIS
jgi:hypothetical protein